MENKHKHKKRNWHNRQGNNKKENHNEKNDSSVKHEKKQYICPLCGQTMQEIASALAHKETGEPVHFDCVLDFIKKTEKEPLSNHGRRLHHYIFANSLNIFSSSFQYGG